LVLDHTLKAAAALMTGTALLDPKIIAPMLDHAASPSIASAKQRERAVFQVNESCVGKTAVPNPRHKRDAILYPQRIAETMRENSANALNFDTRRQFTF
jgi:hypothetical protein